MIEIKNLKFSYGKHKVLDNVNITFEPGMIYGLLGQNGVGKSTLLKIISGLLKVKKGACIVNLDSRNGQTSQSFPFSREPEFLENIYYIPEDFSGPDAVVEKYAKSIGKFYPKFDINKFNKICEQFDIDTKAKFVKLSHGQQKKGIIALALSLGTEILLMDEPTNGLDIPSKTIFRQVIAENVSDNQLIIISTHQVKDLVNIIDPIIILDRSGVLLNATINKISQKLYFGVTPQKDESALYSENVLNGYITVTENNMDAESDVSLEALFNCALNNKEKIKELFK